MEDEGDQIGMDNERDWIENFFGEAHRRSYDQGKAEGRVQGKADGRAEGKAAGLTAAVLRTLRHRGLTIDPEQREQILNCTDISILDRWFERVFSAASADELIPRSMETALERVLRDAHRRMYNRGKANGWNEGKLEGKAESKAEVLLRIVTRRGLAISSEQQQQILACTDLAILDGWFDRSFSVATVDDLLV